MIAGNISKLALGLACTLLLSAQQVEPLRDTEDRALLAPIENASRKDTLRVLQSKLDGIGYRLADPERYGEVVSGAFGAVYSKGAADLQQAHRLEQKYVLLALDRPDRLTASMEIGLVLRLHANVASGEMPEQEEVRTKLNLLFHAWRRMERETNPDYDFSFPPLGSIMPPNEVLGSPGVVGIYPGMDPALVSDSRLRARYLAAIEENRIKLAEFNLQVDLRQRKESFLLNAETFLRVAIRSKSISPAEVIAKLNLVQEEASRKRILAKIDSLQAR